MRLSEFLVKLTGDEVPRTHPAPTRPLSERNPSSGRTRGGGDHLDPLESLLHSSGRQRVGVGERQQKGGGHIVVHHGDAVLRPAAIGREIFVEERLAYRVRLVVLVTTGPTFDG